MLVVQSGGIEHGILDTCRALGIGVTAYGRELGDVVALVGARRPRRITEALPAAELVLCEGELAAVERAVPESAVAGDRHAPAQLAQLDRERP